jgi:hypothetical protein
MQWLAFFVILRVRRGLFPGTMCMRVVRIPRLGSDVAALAHGHIGPLESARRRFSFCVRRLALPLSVLEQRQGGRGMTTWEWRLPFRGMQAWY